MKLKRRSDVVEVDPRDTVEISRMLVRGYRQVRGIQAEMSSADEDDCGCPGGPKKQPEEEVEE